MPYKIVYTDKGYKGSDVFTHQRASTVSIEYGRSATTILITIWYIVVVVSMLLEKKRLTDSAKKIRESENVVQYFILKEDGSLSSKVTTKDKAKHKYGLHEPIQDQIFLEDCANSLKEINFEYDSDEIVYNNNNNGFVPREEWKMTMDMEMLNQAFHKKTQFEVPWKPLIIVMAIVGLIVVVTQMGVI